MGHVTGRKQQELERSIPGTVQSFYNHSPMQPTPKLPEVLLIAHL